VALEIFAGRGCQQEYNIERYLRDVIHTFPAAGTSDVQRIRLAEVALGEYHSAWSSRVSHNGDTDGITSGRASFTGMHTNRPEVIR
jgi:Acyl-CoA dehydrogenase, C-terminal domain